MHCLRKGKNMSGKREGRQFKIEGVNGEVELTLKVKCPFGTQFPSKDHLLSAWM